VIKVFGVMGGGGGNHSRATGHSRS